MKNKFSPRQLFVIALSIIYFCYTCLLYLFASSVEHVAPVIYIFAIVVYWKTGRDLYRARKEREEELLNLSKA